MNGNNVKRLSSLQYMLQLGHAGRGFMKFSEKDVAVKRLHNKYLNPSKQLSSKHPEKQQEMKLQQLAGLNIITTIQVFGFRIRIKK